ncbi:MAG: protein-tyrosine-phosphatase [Chloroflexi bacterium]|nr:MAG: protein-tyrosine-phosphatase [Chloroflexota bacterium]
MPTRVLFVCVHNSARSQMAEGMLRAWGAPAWEAASAGLEATFVRLEAIAAMEEIGIDISDQQSKTLDAFKGSTWDLAITLCDEAAEACPMVPGAARLLHWSLEDPSPAKGTDEQRLDVYRRVRDDLGGRIRELIGVGAPAIA